MTQRDYQLLNTPIKLEFAENNEILVSVDFDQEEQSLIKYISYLDTSSATSKHIYSGETIKYKVEKKPLSKKLELSDTIELPFS